MVHRRFDNEKVVDVSILGEAITFPNKKCIAKNRFMKSAMSEKLAVFKPGDKTNGMPTENLINLYEKFGAGGFGMIVTGNVPVDQDHAEGIGNMLIDERLDTLERRLMFSRLANAGKKEGSRMIVQLGHAGNMTPVHINSTPLSSTSVAAHPSNKPWKIFGKPIQIKKCDMKEKIIDKYVYAANFCYDCGFDGVEIHAAYGFFLASFLSEKLNGRRDEYGGSIANRSRIIFDIYKAIREAIPIDSSFLIGIKICAVDFKNAHSNLIDIGKLMTMIDAAPFDFIELSGGEFEKPPLKNSEIITCVKGAFYDKTISSIQKQLKKSILYLSGGFRTSYGMVTAVQEQFTQGISIGKPAAAEPDLPYKILEKRVFSCAKYDYFNYALTENGALSQMYQLSRKSLKDSKQHILEGVMDLSNPTTARKFFDAYALFVQGLIVSFKQNKPINDLFEWTSTR
uniref:Oxidored_FMN domain-containing protein n=1 Tax=Parastrongyloides trichosuri TaxID=131310 RepID=A0A0N4ZYV0_PARTI